MDRGYARNTVQYVNVAALTLFSYRDLSNTFTAGQLKKSLAILIFFWNMNETVYFPLDFFYVQQRNNIGKCLRYSRRDFFGNNKINYN